MVERLRPYHWFHHNPVQVYAGAGAFEQLCQLVPEGRSLFITSTGFTTRGQTERVMTRLGADRTIVHDKVTPNPDLDDLDDLRVEYRDAKVASILALGGGSVLDTAKVLSVTLANGNRRSLTEIFREGKAERWPVKIPVIAVPTTAGTGAEVTSFATVWDRPERRKFSLDNGQLFPRYALLDPCLTLTLSYRETLYGALDTVSHALESLWNRKRTPVSQALAVQSLRHVSESLRDVLEDPDDLGKRAQMQYASMLAGLAINQTRTAIAHSMSYPLTAHFDVPHGLACGFTLSSILKFVNVRGILPESGPFLRTIEELLDSFGLEDEMSRYTSYDEALGLVGAMYTPERAGNFIAKVDRSDVESILQGSFRCRP
jgi:alcohol dehydrogenase